MRKTYIICKANYNGNTVFECKNCGRGLSNIKLAKIEKCPKCEREFKPVIKVER